MRKFIRIKRLRQIFLFFYKHIFHAVFIIRNITFTAEQIFYIFVDNFIIIRQIRPRDYVYFDYIIAMDDSNIDDILEIVGPDTERKIYRLLDFTNHPRNIRDPWYTGNFDESYWYIYEGCQAFLEHLKL